MALDYDAAHHRTDDRRDTESSCCPDSLKEAALALGLPFHRVIFKVIVPVGVSGILSGVMLSIARITGEFAPLFVHGFREPLSVLQSGQTHRKYYPC